MTKKMIRLATVLLSTMAIMAGPANAAENNNNSATLPVFHTTSYQNEYSWRHDNGDYTQPTAATDLSEIAPESGGKGLAAANPRTIPQDKVTIKQEKPKSADKDYVDNILEKVPYSKQLKATWHFIDGKTDIYDVKGLRVDRNNRGLEYRTNTVPLMGEVEGLEIKAEVGQDQALGFKSNIIPFVGQVEGFELKASAGTDNSKASVRYTISLDKLGL